MLVPILLIGCGSKPDNPNQYENEDLGIEITIPSNWKQISADEVGQEVADSESDLLRLGFFDPETGKKEGIFILSTIQGSELDQIKSDLEDPEVFKKIKWKNHSCYYNNITVNAGTQCDAYTIIKNETPITFLIGYTESHAEYVTNIMDNIIF